MSRRLTVPAFGLAALVAIATPALAQTAAVDPDAARRMNEAVAGVIGGAPGSAALDLAVALADLVEGADRLRVVPMAVAGPVQRVSDLLYLRTVDAAIVPADALGHIATLGLHEDVATRVHYIARLAPERVHLVVRRGTSLAMLAGRPVAVPADDSAEAITGRALFAAAGQEAEWRAMAPAAAVAALKAGSVDGLILTGEAARAVLAPIERSDGLELAELAAAGGNPAWQAAHVAPEELPGLVITPAGVGTVAVPQVLAVFNWPARTLPYYRLRRLTEALTERIATAEPPWHGVNLAADVPGWTQFAASRSVLERLREQVSLRRKQQEPLRESFRRALQPERLAVPAGSKALIAEQ